MIHITQYVSLYWWFNIVICHALVRVYVYTVFQTTVFTLDKSQTITHCYIILLTTSITCSLHLWRFYDTVIDMCLICSIVNSYVYIYIRLSVSVTCFLLFEALVEDWHVKRVTSWTKVFIKMIPNRLFHFVHIYRGIFNTLIRSIVFMAKLKHLINTVGILNKPV